ncbi:hypothetical protein SCARD494_00925 [Seiridium cardinale]
MIASPRLMSYLYLPRSDGKSRAVQGSDGPSLSNRPTRGPKHGPLGNLANLQLQHPCRDPALLFVASGSPLAGSNDGSPAEYKPTYPARCVLPPHKGCTATSAWEFLHWLPLSTLARETFFFDPKFSPNREGRYISTGK